MNFGHHFTQLGNMKNFKHNHPLSSLNLFSLQSYSYLQTIIKCFNHTTHHNHLFFFLQSSHIQHNLLSLIFRHAPTKNARSSDWIGASTIFPHHLFHLLLRSWHWGISISSINPPLPFSISWFSHFSSINLIFFWICSQSTGSFFHDRSTTLGTLMGVSFPPITFRAPSQHRDPHSATAGSAAALGGSRRTTKPKKKKNRSAAAADVAAVVAERRRRWWSLCRDGDTRPASLGEFLEVERRFGDGAFYGTAAELEGMVMGQQRNNGRVLFANGRVLPPAADVDDGAPTAGSLCNRFPVSLTGICSGGAWMIG